MKNVRHTTALQVAGVTGIGLLVGSSVRAVTTRLDVVPPRPGWVAALALAGLAFGLASVARGTWRNLRDDKRQMSSELGIRLLALAKAGITAGALFLGAYGGFALSYLEDLDTALGRERVLQSGAAGLASIAVIAAGLWLERSLRLPEDDDPPPGASRTT
ncbi:DUF3180 domain-containing protein [Aeromicrobium sp. CF4.19]|uniref:DUF3180 domain-containing protein n=1 Tax=Aeromicrobium sp. CF4.19 TaxID=3373082 RepID=UPI003EE4A648